MAAAATAFDAIAGLLAYPREGHAARCAELASAVADVLPGADLGEFVRFAAENDLGACEELHVRTFDGDPDTALETGWQVFGEQYARGAFLVRLRERMRELGVEENGELPDHATHVLRLVARMEPEEAAALCARALGPSLARIRKAVGEGNPYACVLAAAAGAAAEIAPAAPDGAAGRRESIGGMRR